MTEAAIHDEAAHRRLAHRAVIASALGLAATDVTHQRNPMSGAVRLQLRGASYARRVVAAITGVWLVAFGILGASHEARVAHYVDAATGSVFHAAPMISDHTCNQSDVHQASTTADHDACGIASVLHQAARPSVAHVLLATAREPGLAPVVPATRNAVANQLVYRLAPKTSPPVAA